MRNQYQMFYAAQKKCAETLAHATWMAGLGAEKNPNPMTWAEVQQAAQSRKPYAWAFQMIVSAREALTAADLELDAIAAAKHELQERQLALC